MVNNKKFGLSLSGGGYRATTYHLGTLKKLKEMGLLDKVDVVSSNSGGSITAATYGLHLDNYELFEDIIRKGVQRSVIGFVLTSFRMLIPLLFVIGILVVGIIALFKGFVLYGLFGIVGFVLLIAFFQFKLFPISELNAKAYSKFFLKNTSLSKLSPKIELAINSTNLETGRLFVFSRTYMNDSKYEYGDDLPKKIEFDPSSFPLSRAVAASTAVPGVFTPIKIAKKFYEDSNDYNLVKPRLVDGGVYDNQGLHKLTQSNSKFGCDIIVVSDAGDEMPFQHKYLNSLALLFRTGNVFMNRIKNLQMIHQLFQPRRDQHHELAYQSLGWDLDRSIPEFIKSLKNGYIKKYVYEYHGITSEDIELKKWDEIERKLKQSINYDQIIKQEQSKADLDIARAVGTNLTPLSTPQIESLISHAYIMTEIQVKLYCPSLFS